MPVAPQPALPRGWILYDADCGLCRRTVHRWQATVTRRGFAIKSLQAAQADGTLQIAPKNLLDDIRLLTRTGQRIDGADAYLHIARQIWWTWPFYAVFNLPGFHWLLARTYRWINRNRHRISSTCALR